MSKIRIAQAQMKVMPSVELSFKEAEKYLLKAKEENADMLCLPEMFCCPYETKNFPLYAQLDGGEMKKKASELAAKYGIIFSAGSVPESDEEGHVYNTAYVFGRNGEQLAKHRKMHLFNIDVKGGQRFFESETLTAGNEVTVFDTEFGKMGLCICYDIRFPELTRSLVLGGLDMLFVVSQWPKVRVPHLKALAKARAIENQMFLACCNSCGTAGDTVYGGASTITDPWGETLAEAGSEEETISAAYGAPA